MSKQIIKQTKNYSLLPNWNKWNLNNITRAQTQSPKIKLQKNVIIRERKMEKRNKKPNKKGRNNYMIEIESNLGPT